MKFEFNMKLGFEISESFMEDDGNFDDGVKNGDIKIDDFDFSVLEVTTGEVFEVNEDNKAELMELFMNALNKKVGAE